jgi:hypothetical protein
VRYFLTLGSAQYVITASFVGETKISRIAVLLLGSLQMSPPIEPAYFSCAGSFEHLQKTASTFFEEDTSCSCFFLSWMVIPLISMAKNTRSCVFSFCDAADKILRVRGSVTFVVFTSAVDKGRVKS